MEYSKLRSFVVAAVKSSEVTEKGSEKLNTYVPSSVKQLISNDDKISEVEFDTTMASKFIKAVFEDIRDDDSRIDLDRQTDILFKSRIALIETLVKSGLDDNQATLKAGLLQKNLFKFTTVINLLSSLYDYNEEFSSINDAMVDELDYQARIVCDHVVVKVQEIMSLL